MPWCEALRDSLRDRGKYALSHPSTLHGAWQKPRAGAHSPYFTIFSSLTNMLPHARSISSGVIL